MTILSHNLISTAKQMNQLYDDFEIEARLFL